MSAVSVKTFVKKRTCNGSKYCIFANCTSDGRTLPKDTDVTFVPFPKPCVQFRNEEIEFLLKKERGRREHDTSRCAKCCRSFLWMQLSQRTDRLTKLTDVTSNMFVCSKHFLDGNRADSNADPLPANISPHQVIVCNVVPSAIVVNCKQETQEAESVGDVEDGGKENEGLKLARDNVENFALKMMSSGWASLLEDDSASFVRYDKETLSSLVEVRVSLADDKNLTFQTFVLGRCLPVDCDLHRTETMVKNLQDLRYFMRLLRDAVLCAGISNPESDGSFCHQRNAVRTVGCKLFSLGPKCAPCLRYERALQNSMNKKEMSAGKRCNDRFLTREQLLAKVRSLKAKDKVMSVKLKRLSERVRKLQNKTGPKTPNDHGHYIKRKS